MEFSIWSVRKHFPEAVWTSSSQNHSEADLIAMTAIVLTALIAEPLPPPLLLHLLLLVRSLLSGSMERPHPSLEAPFYLLSDGGPSRLGDLKARGLLCSASFQVAGRHRGLATNNSLTMFDTGIFQVHQAVRILDHGPIDFCRTRHSPCESLSATHTWAPLRHR